MCGLAFHHRHSARLLETIHGGECDLLLRFVFPSRFAQRVGGLLHVQNIVNDLECQAQMLAVPGQGSQCVLGADA